MCSCVTGDKRLPVDGHCVCSCVTGDKRLPVDGHCVRVLVLPMIKDYQLKVIVCMFLCYR